jgi:hypothetical protein
VNSLASVRHVGAAGNCTIIALFEFGGAPRAKHSRRTAKADLPSFGISALAIVGELMGELLKFVVKSRLPIERLRQSIT